MKDPHVAALHYEFVFGPGVNYKPPPGPVAYAHPDFEIEIRGAHVTFRPRAHFADRATARAACDLVVRGWEITTAIEVGRCDVSLKYRSADLIDRCPTPGVTTVSVEMSGNGGTVFGHAAVIRGFKKYPSAPEVEFEVTPDVQSLWQRYAACKEGKEPLQSMAYFALTLLESHGINRAAAAAAMQVEEAVLRKLGELSTNRGDSLTARKLTSRLVLRISAHRGRRFRLIVDGISR